ncbi:probable receptor-like protein kinase At5g39020 [Rhodamnia argentea]|uniref:Probable receptor-like protein kinase At5g39020 n=1 Tax=Rhodamnia argentea TaxID=178133 RepID=A0ABM3HJS8_9MYRT|nr:probable receptor-like protein kinase At5g39020 [Rhodamnia argentea]
MALVKQRSEHFNGEMKIEGHASSRRYTYKDIKRMTNSFEEKLGQGGYGCMYKGQLRDSLMVVKLLKKLKGNVEEFFNEVVSKSTTSHVNVVNFLGYYFEGSKRALVYEFMPNGSLENYGMMVLEMVGGRKNIEVGVDHTSEIYFPDRRLELQEELGLHGITNGEDEGIAKKMIVISLWCIRIDPRARPSMTQVVKMLKGSVEALQFPPKPTFSSPSRSLAASPGEISSLQESNGSS